MGFFSNLFGLTATNDDIADINPANGLPMMGAVDIEGNPYGTDYDDFDLDNLETSPFGDGLGGMGDTSSIFDDDF